MGVGPGPGGGEASGVGMEGATTEGIDGRFAKDQSRTGGRACGKEALVFLGTRSQAPPRALGGAAEFGADRLVFVVQQEKDGVGSEVRRGRS